MITEEQKIIDLENEISFLKNVLYEKQKEIEELSKLHYDLGSNFIDLDSKFKQQQKEIKKLTRLKSAYKTNFYSKVLKEERKNKKILEGYISKEKIRSLLNQVNASLYHFKDSEKNNIIQRIKDRLEKLLEE